MRDLYVCPDKSALKNDPKSVEELKKLLILNKKMVTE